MAGAHSFEEVKQVLAGFVSDLIRAELHARSHGASARRSLTQAGIASPGENGDEDELMLVCRSSLAVSCWRCGDLAAGAGACGSGVPKPTSCA
jgi:hypothetical protein